MLLCVVYAFWCSWLCNVVAGNTLDKPHNAKQKQIRQLGVSLNAVNLRAVFEDDRHVHMVMELCEGGALLERVQARAYSEWRIAAWVRAILRFIAQCHAKGIVYRDVKPVRARGGKETQGR